MRRLDVRTTPKAKAVLRVLADQQTNVEDYRNAFYELGVLLGKQLPPTRVGENALLVCTSEDADFLARGVLDSVLDRTPGPLSNLSLACFWQTRLTVVPAAQGRDAIDVAPIVKRYEEPSPETIDSLIVVKSIISSSCVVKHALLDVIGRKHPRNIFIVAPVILRGAQGRLRAEFPLHVSRRFQFIYFAEDDECDESGNVLPGIGGSVYDRLGLSEQGRALMPSIVAKRRQAM
jgi:hypothetical protein